MKYDISLRERETIINFNEEDRIADVYTTNKALQKKLDFLCEKFPNDFKLNTDDPDWDAKSYIISKMYIKINAPIVLSEKEKQRRSARMYNMRHGNV